MLTFVSGRVRPVRVAALAAAIALAGMAVDRSSRAAESHPDFNGVWAVIQHDGPSDRFSMAADPPLSAKGHAVIDPYRAKYDVKKYDMEPNQYCVEHGMPTAMFGLGGMPMEVLLQPHRMSIFSEAANQFRRIFIDGRKMPDDFPPTPNGYSIGHWEGDTLVVETGALEEWYLARWPHSEHARFVERFSIKDAKDVKLPRPLRPGITLSGKILIDEMTMIDPDLYDKPASVTYYYRQLGDDEIFYDGCSQGLWQAEFDRRIEKGQTGKAQ